jgi:hypothetical protein
MSTPNKAAVGRPLHDNQFDVAVSMVEFDDDDEGCKTPPELAHNGGDAATASAAADAHAIRIGGADQVKRVNEADARTQMRQLAPKPAAAAPAAGGGGGSLDADQVAAAAAALAAMRHAADAVASARKAIEGQDLGNAKPRAERRGASSSNESSRRASSSSSSSSSSKKSDADTVDSDDEGAKAKADSDAKAKPASHAPALAHAPPEVQARFARLDVGDRTAWHEYSLFDAKAGMSAARETANKPEDVAFDLEESADFVPTPPGEREHPHRGITLADCNHAVDDKEKATADKAAAAEASAAATASKKSPPASDDDDDDQDDRVPPPPKVSRQDAGAPPRGLFGAPDVAQKQKKGEVLKGQVHDLAVSASMDYSLSAQYSIATDAGLGSGGATRSSLGAPPAGDKKGVSVGESKKLHATVLKNQAMDLAFSVSASADFSQQPAKKDGDDDDDDA